MISADEALKLILENSIDYGAELLPLSEVIGRILAEDILADRPLPPFDRVCMDGIAIDSKGFSDDRQLFPVEKIGAAGMPQQELEDTKKCIEIMTGAVLPLGTDTVIRYEDLEKNDEGFKVLIDVQPKKNIHYKAEDLEAGELLIPKGQRIKAIDINLLASVGKVEVLVRKHPRVAVISSGDELVAVDQKPLDHQIRRSNVHMLLSRLRELGINANDYHLKDYREDIRGELRTILDTYDVILMSGGVSKGCFDFIPGILDELEVENLFHFVRQRPGKPLWVGRKEDKMVFAFPGNPVSTLACFHQYFIPWLDSSVGLSSTKKIKVRLLDDITFKPDLTYYAQAIFSISEEGVCQASVAHGHGSGDMVNPSSMDGFVVLPRGKEVFKASEVYDFIPFYPLFK